MLLSPFQCSGNPAGPDCWSEIRPQSSLRSQRCYAHLSFSVFASYPTNILIREKRSQQSFVFSDLLCTAEYHPQRAGLDWPECKFCPLCTSIYCPFLPWTKFQPHFSWFFFIPLTAFFPVLIVKNVWADMMLIVGRQADTCEVSVQSM